VTVRALILFDIDGTLLEPGDRLHSQAILDAFREVFGLEPRLDGTPLAGMLDAQITRLMLEKHRLIGRQVEHEIANVMNRAGELYEEAMHGISNRHRLLPGAVDAASAVSQRGWISGTLTGNARRIAETKLKAAGLGSLVEIGAFGDAAHERGHLVEIAIAEAEKVTATRFKTSETVLVGDTPRDIDAARHASVGVLAVSTGRFDIDTLSQYHPDAVLPNLRDSHAFISALERVLAVISELDTVI
jgi:phosphoglycolate phosphatase